MFLASKNDGPPPKNIITIARLQNYINKDQPPSKKEPFRTVSEAPVGHTLHVVTSASYPSDALARIAQTSTLQYARVHMKLIEVVTGDFFAQYIKTGNIAMISEGRQGHDETYSLQDGMLRLEVFKQTYERLGLEGKPVVGHGRKHTKARYLIELNLRLPSMVSGKKGFQRVLWAFKNVLVDAKAWLFCNVAAPSDLTGPVNAFAPLVRTVTPGFKLEEDVDVPDFGLNTVADEEDAADLQEWLSLVTLGSPRVKVGDIIDPYLSRYSLPAFQPADSTSDVEAVSDEDMPDVAEQASGIRQTTIRGLIHPDYVRSLYMSLLKTAPKGTWVAVTVHSFTMESYTIITKDKHAIIYQFKD